MLLEITSHCNLVIFASLFSLNETNTEHQKSKGNFILYSHSLLLKFRYTKLVGLFIYIKRFKNSFKCFHIYRYPLLDEQLRNSCKCSMCKYQYILLATLKVQKYL